MLKKAKSEMKVGTYETRFFQHRMKNLVFALWADNNIVKTLSNFHSPELLEAGHGVLRRRRVDGLREQERTAVQCPLQQKDYSETFHLIDKGNGKESHYDMGGQTKGHNWAPKLTMRFWNMGLGNAHTMYSALCKKFTPNRKVQTMDQCMKILAHSLMQRGPPMRKQVPEHPAYERDLTNVFDWGTGRKIRSDTQGHMSQGVARGNSSYVLAPHQRERDLKAKQKKQQWRIHQSVAGGKSGYCKWIGCPGLKQCKAKQKRSYRTYMRCEECTAQLGKEMFLCNDVKSGTAVNCHFAHHKKYHTKKYEDKL